MAPRHLQASTAPGTHGRQFFHISIPKAFAGLDEYCEKNGVVIDISIPEAFTGLD